MSKKLHISLACWDYDRTRALQEGSVEVEGVDLNFLPLRVEETFWRMLRYQEFDACELSMGSYLIARERGYPPLVAIPVFPSRAFRHASVFINTDAEIREPKDLMGKRVGVPEYQMTMAIWVRGILQHEHGVPPDKIRWFTGGQEEPGRISKVSHDLPQSIDISSIEPDQTLSSMLESGELDALMSAHLPVPFVRRSPKVRRLIPNFREVEREYYRRTKIFPIMHCVALREDVYQNYPWLAQSLYKAFCEAKEICQASMYEFSALRYMLAWSIAEIEEEMEIFGDELWPYGLKANRHCLETLVHYAHEQGLITKEVDVRDLFAPNTLEDFKI
jgi:4,5-dihydroxyphthalate decarboxylase